MNSLGLSGCNRSSGAMSVPAGGPESVRAGFAGNAWQRAVVLAALAALGVSAAAITLIGASGGISLQTTTKVPYLGGALAPDSETVDPSQAGVAGQSTTAEQYVGGAHAPETDSAIPSSTGAGQSQRTKTAYTDGAYPPFTDTVTPSSATRTASDTIVTPDTQTATESSQSLSPSTSVNTGAQAGVPATYSSVTSAPAVSTNAGAQAGVPAGLSAQASPPSVSTNVGARAGVGAQQSSQTSSPSTSTNTGAQAGKPATFAVSTLPPSVSVNSGPVTTSETVSDPATPDEATRVPSSTAADHTYGNGTDLPYDRDNDRCPDQNELGPDEKLGGRRDPTNPWDYFNPTKDGVNRVDDILKVVGQYFKDQYLPTGKPNPEYNVNTDRTYVGPNRWNLGPPNGQQRVDDIRNAVYSYFHDCP